jgi:hypothetical protein
MVGELRVLVGYDRIELAVGVACTRRRAFLPWGDMWGTNKQGRKMSRRSPRNLAFTAFVPPLPLTPEIDCCSKFDSRFTNKLKVKMPTTLKEFESVWPRIVADLQDHCKGYNLPKQSLDWFTKVLP